MGDELVTRSSELRTHARFPELRTIDNICIVFDTDSHGERLLYDIESLRKDHLIRITSGVSDRENKSITLDAFSSIHHDSDELAIHYLHIRHTRTESDIRSESDNLLAQFTHEDTELVCTDMCLRCIHDLLWGSGCYHLFEDIFTARVINHGIEFSITKCPRSPFAELDIGFSIECSSLHEHPNIDKPPLDCLATLNNDRIESCLGKCKSGK